MLLYKTGGVVSIRLCNYSEAQGRGHIYQANSLWPWYKYCMYALSNSVPYTYAMQKYARKGCLVCHCVSLESTFAKSWIRPLAHIVHV